MRILCVVVVIFMALSAHVLHMPGDGDDKDDDTDPIRPEQPPMWRVGVLAGAAPYVIDIENRQGYDIELLGMIAAEMGHRLELTSGSIMRLERLVKTGSVDAVLTHGKPRTGCQQTMVVNNWVDALIYVTPDKTMTHKRILTYMGGTRLLTQALLAGGIDPSGLDIVEIMNSGKTAQLINRRKFDAVFTDKRRFFYEMEKSHGHVRDRVVLSDINVKDPHRICVSNQSTLSVDDVNKALTAIRTTSEYADIIARYGE